MIDDMIPRSEAHAMVAAKLTEALWEAQHAADAEIAADRIRALIDAPADAALQRMLREAVADSPGVAAIAKERGRQTAEEGWTADHDDTHAGGEMAKAAACYAWAATVSTDVRETFESAAEGWRLAQMVRRLWPWQMSWWKPKSAREDLVRAGALIAAEIDRLDRLARAAEVREGGA